MAKYTIGQQVFITFLHERNKSPFIGVINSVGKLYFTIDCLRHTKFNISDREEKRKDRGHNQDYKIWLSEDEYKEHILLSKQKRILIEKIPTLDRGAIQKILEIISINID